MPRTVQLFERRCSGCHALNENQYGPQLDSVYGRGVASATGFRYSSALQAQQFTWNEQTLDAWLSGPRQFVPGAAMPVRVSVPAERADLITYLRSLVSGS